MTTHVDRFDQVTVRAGHHPRHDSDIADHRSPPRKPDGVQIAKLAG